MFYSQFILAKKGPLGTIWIAAHLERKLRKNQVADTDIGVSVDSILSPDVPIALRLSSHLLLGVVRIYSRKVNYLFDDSSEALLKVKQAFRSAAVDLPPEESRAPYHSITLPESFDLEDFELPDNDIFQGSFVDHHISSREHITLQDNIGGVGYSTSKFGLDERFGDGDASGLDLDEELFLDKIDSAGQASERSVPQAMITLKRDEHRETTVVNSGIRVDDVDDNDDPMDYAQAPSTPGLVEESNLSNAQEASDHLETECPLVESTMTENVKNSTCGDQQEVDWCSHNNANSDAIPMVLTEENRYQSDGLNINLSKELGEYPIEANVEHLSVDESSLVFKPNSDSPLNPDLEFADKINKSLVVDKPNDDHHGPHETVLQEKSDCEISDGLNINLSKESGEYPIEAKVEHLSVDSLVSKPNFDLSLNPDLDFADKINESLVVDKPNDDHQGLHEIVLQEKSDCEFSEGVLVKDQGLIGIEVPNSVEIARNGEKSCPDASDLASINQDGSLNLDVREKVASTENLFLRSCNSNVENPDITFGCVMSTDADVQSDVAAVDTSGREEMVMLGKASCIIDNSEETLKENLIQEHAAQEDVHPASSKPNSQVHNANSRDGLVENLNNSKEAELPAPEKLLSVPEGHVDLHQNMLVEVIPKAFVGLDKGDAGRELISGKKRSFTESTLTEQSLNSVESSRLVRFKRTVESVPDDDDLLSSILVGRSSVLKVKPTPRLSKVTSMKRTRSAPRSGASKRKVLMDDTMVLHGDTIRQQLTNTEDIRRVRKKAPCTHPETSIIRKQYLEDEVFLEPIFTGTSLKLVSLHSQPCDLSGITVINSDLNGASLEPVAELRLPSENDENVVPLETLAENMLASHDVENDHSLTTGMGGEPCITSLNDENGECPRLSNNMMKEVDETNEEISISREPTKTITDVLSLDVTGVQTSEQNDNPVNSSDTARLEPLHSIVDDVSDGIVQPGSLIETVDTNTSVNADTAAVLHDEKTDVPSVELDSAVMDVDNGQAISKHEVTVNDGDFNNEPEARDDVLPEVPEDGATVEIHSVVSGEHIVASLYPAEIGQQEDGFVINGENPEVYQQYMMDAEVSGFDLHDDHEELKFSAAGNDTEFLNVDDDELNEIADEHIPDDEEAQFTENTGWSSRTRAVSKYLQTLFLKEAEFGRKSLYMDNLLIGKSRKEASRMFFEALVLKTRDYIHVEQHNPFDDVTIKPQTRLMKSDF